MSKKVLRILPLLLLLPLFGCSRTWKFTLYPPDSVTVEYEMGANLVFWDAAQDAVEDWVLYRRVKSSDGQLSEPKIVFKGFAYQFFDENFDHGLTYVYSVRAFSIDDQTEEVFQSNEPEVSKYFDVNFSLRRFFDQDDRLLSETLGVSYSNASENPISFRILDPNSQVLYSEVIKPSPQSTGIGIALETALLSGVYTLEIKNSGDISRKTLNFRTDVKLPNPTNVRIIEMTDKKFVAKWDSFAKKGLTTSTGHIMADLHRSVDGTTDYGVSLNSYVGAEFDGVTIEPPVLSEVLKVSELYFLEIEVQVSSPRKDYTETGIPIQVDTKIWKSSLFSLK